VQHKFCEIEALINNDNVHEGVLEVGVAVDTVLVTLHPKGSFVPRAVPRAGVEAACEIVCEALAPSLPRQILLGVVEEDNGPDRTVPP